MSQGNRMFAITLAVFLSVVTGLIVWGFNATYTPVATHCGTYVGYGADTRDCARY